MRIVVTIAAALLCGAAYAQAPRPCDTPESHQLDFWLGTWDLTYTQNGQQAKSHNHISKILDGCVVLEEFSGAPGVALEGRSVSMFDRATRRWKQTWVDNSGSYLDFEGEAAAGGGMVFAREFTRNGQRVMQRMVFDEVKPDSLHWRWERSLDGGATWSTQWDIRYERTANRSVRRIK